MKLYFLEMEIVGVMVRGSGLTKGFIKKTVLFGKH
jgi:hypothetical protein